MTSRVVVKGLPKYATQERIKKFFSKIGKITDIKLVRTKNGESRRFCYIGFKTDEQGLEAVQYFDKSFMDTCQLEVQIAKTIGSDEIDRPWSKYSKGSSAHKEIEEQTQNTEVEEKNEERKKKFLDFMEDKEFQEFVEVMRPRNANKKQTWANDDAGAQQVSDDELYEDLPALKKEDPVDSKENQKNADDEKEVMNIHPARLKVLVEQGLVDPEKIINLYKEPEEAAEIIATDTVTIDDTPSPDLIADTGRIMVRNLHYSCTHDELQEAFSKFGEIAEIHLPMDKITNESKGYAFILYMIPEDAVKAFDALDRSIFQGRIIEIVAAKERKKQENEENEPKTFKAQREQTKKQNAGKDYNWNSLFMNSDAVAEAMARKLGVRKAEILDSAADDMAVKLALAETAIIQETKEYLEKEGVILDSFGTNQKRSSTVILVKNIPTTTEEYDLVDLFNKYGQLGRIILPPARTIAIVEFGDRNEAKVAFRKLAYKKFKNLPLYLEWAPANTFATEFNAEMANKEREEKKIANAKVIPDKEENDHPPAATVFVKNINFSTSDDGLKKAFEPNGGLRSARISTKPNGKGGRMSMGFGFLEFDTVEDAMRCIKGMQNFILDGHQLLLKFSNNRNENTFTNGKKRSYNTEEKDDATKIVVRNLPFEASKKDLQKLFSQFGAVKFIRLPRKFDGKHRGFAFVEFVTPQEAKVAMTSMSSTHLYGRHLVMEWAKEDDTVEELRAKTAKTFSEGSRKKGRIEMEDFEDY